MALLVPLQKLWSVDKHGNPLLLQPCPDVFLGFSEERGFGTTNKSLAASCCYNLGKKEEEKEKEEEEE